MDPAKIVEPAPLTKQPSAPKQGATGPMALHDVLDKIRLDVNQKQAELTSTGGKEEQKVPAGGAGVADGDLTTVEEQKEKENFERQFKKLDSSLAVREENDVRVAVIGNVDSGKSTLVGVLTKGLMDDGRGLARSKVFNFDHEQKNGRTSSIG